MTALPTLYSESVPAAEKLRRRAIDLEYLTVAWNSAEAVIALVAGWLAGSIALVGFGFDSVIETTAGVVLLWRLRQRGDLESQAESRALRIVGGTFFALAAYVSFESVRDLRLHQAPEESTVGIVLAAVSLVVMPMLARAKQRVAQAMGSHALAAEAMETWVCAYLSFALLLGLTLNAWRGWWWADPVAALAMVPLMLHEGWESVRGRHAD
ncbi:MAG: cation transporter [Firmicutes bacterium]|nr:cation transporter [Bacillota bacterium]